MHESRDYLISRWEAVRAGLIETIDRFSDDELAFRPFPTSWTVRELMLHIAHEEHGEFNYGLVQTLPDFPPPYEPDDYPTLTAVKARLESVHGPVVERLRLFGDADLSRQVETPWGASYRVIEMVDHLVEHEIHHRGELSLILGLLGRPGLDA